MARTALTITNAPGSYPTTGVAVTWNAGDPTNENDFPFGGNELILVKNDAAADPGDIILSSVADYQGRLGSITEEITALTQVRMYGPFTDRSGWLQSGGKFFLDPETADIKIAVIRLPRL